MTMRLRRGRGVDDSVESVLGVISGTEFMCLEFDLWLRCFLAVIWYEVLLGPALLLN